MFELYFVNYYVWHVYQSVNIWWKWFSHDGLYIYCVENYVLIMIERTHL